MVRGVVAVVGAGPGLGQMIGNLSFEVAKKFGQEGFKIAFISLAASTLELYAKELKALGITDVETFRSDVFDLPSQEALYTDVQAKMGPITVLIWNHFAHVLEPALSQTPEQLESQFKGLAALMRSVQLVAPQQEAHLEDKPAILITGNGMGLVERESVQKAAAHAGAHILAAHSAAKHSLAATLHHSLQPKGIKVVEVVIQGVIQGTALDRGDPGTLAPEEVAEVFWKQYNAEAGEPWYAFI